MTFRPRRSVLYMPSSNERALEKAKTLPVDGLILDLEDAVAPDAKAAARDNACAAAASGDYGRREVTIRVNGADTPWHDDDLRAACAAGPDAIVVPPRMSAYAAASRAVFEVFRDTTPLVEGLSIDEAFLDVGGFCTASVPARPRSRLTCGGRSGSGLVCRSPSAWPAPSSSPRSPAESPNQTGCWWCPPTRS